MQPYLRNIPKTYDFRNFLCKDLSYFVENYRKYTSKPQNQPSEQNLEKKNFQKKIYRERHTHSEVSAKGGTALIYRRLRLYNNQDAHHL